MCSSCDAAGLALLVYLSRHADMNGGAIAREYVAIAAAKVSMPFWTARFKGMLCNVLVGLVYHVIYLRAPDKG